LESKEDELCPACWSDRSHKRKTIAKIGIGFAVVALVVFKIISGGDDD
jgi:hypothetical protein